MTILKRLHLFCTDKLFIFRENVNEGKIKKLIEKNSYFFIIGIVFFFLGLLFDITKIISESDSDSFYKFEIGNKAFLCYCIGLCCMSIAGLMLFKMKKVSRFKAINITFWFIGIVSLLIGFRHDLQKIMPESGIDSFHNLEVGMKALLYCFIGLSCVSIATLMLFFQYCDKNWERMKWILRCWVIMIVYAAIHIYTYFIFNDEVFIFLGIAAGTTLMIIMACDYKRKEINYNKVFYWISCVIIALFPYIFVYI